MENALIQRSPFAVRCSWARRPAVKPIGGLLRKPATAAATLAALAALLLFVTSTVSAMLGLGGGSELEVRARPKPYKKPPRGRAGRLAAVCDVHGQRHAMLGLGGGFELEVGAQS